MMQRLQQTELPGEAYTLSKAKFGIMPGPYRATYFVWRKRINARGEHIGSEYLHHDGIWRESTKHDNEESESYGVLTGYFQNLGELKRALRRERMHSTCYIPAEVLEERRAA